MTTSHTNGKQRDRVASYSGGMLSRANSNGSSSSNQTNQKKKPYRARGCRGGASRKGRKKQAITHHSRQNEENDPSRLNANSEKHSYNSSRDGQNHKSIYTSNKRERDTKDACGEPRTNFNTQSKARTLSILPKGNGFGVHQGGVHSSESNTQTGLSDQSQLSRDSISGQKPILPNMASDGGIQTRSKAESSGLSAIARPDTTSRDRGGPSATGSARTQPRRPS